MRTRGSGQPVRGIGGGFAARINRASRERHVRVWRACMACRCVSRDRHTTAYGTARPRTSPRAESLISSRARAALLVSELNERTNERTNGGARRTMQFRAGINRFAYRPDSRQLRNRFDYLNNNNSRNNECRRRCRAVLHRAVQQARVVFAGHTR